LNSVNDPIRVLHVLRSIDPAKGTGPAEALRALALEQAKAGMRVTIITADAIGAVDSIVAPLREAGIVVLPSGPLRGPIARGKFSRAMLRKTLGGGIDVMHIHGLWDHLPHAATREARRAGVPYVVRTAGMLEPWALNKGRWKKRLHLMLASAQDLRQARALQATSFAEARNLVELGFGTPVAVVPHGVDFEPKASVRRDALAEARWPALKGTRRLLFLGRIDPVKGTMPLAEAFGRVSKDFPDWRLVVAGPDWARHKATFEAALAARGVLSKTLFVGSVRGEDKRNLLSSCDVFVQPSFQENFGITIAEALAAGRPVITTKATPWQVLPVRGAGWFIDLGAAPLEKALREAMSMDRSTLDHMGSKGPWIIEERSSWPRIARRLSHVYEWVVGVEGRGERPDFVYLTKDQMPEGWGAWGARSNEAPARLGPALALPRLSLPIFPARVNDAIVRYGLMLAIVAATVLLRLGIDPWVKDRLSLFLAYVAVAVSTLLLGVWEGLAALVIGYIINSLLFIEPRGSLALGGTIEWFKTVLYGCAGLATCAAAAWLRRREREARERQWAAEVKISAQAAELARSNAELERFAEAVARDLKDPLRGIAVKANQLVESQRAGQHHHPHTANTRELAESMDRLARRGLVLVDSLMELSRAGWDLRPQDVDLSEVLDEVLEELAPLIAEDDVEVIRHPLPVAHCDRAQVSRIFKVLIKNGIAHNASDIKEVEIGTSDSGEHPASIEGSRGGRIPAIYVRDNGVGIAPEQRERVFELFSRARDDDETGGAGLALVKKLVKCHGGVVWVESRPGTGSTFYFTLAGNGQGVE
jgi:signal transduction histidine kinase/glycosyltransferase involved in cell wall biosynthesis